MHTDMDMDQFAAAYEKHEAEHVHFERIPAHTLPSKRPDLCGFILLDKLLPTSKAGDIIGAAEHDKIWLNIDLEQLAPVITEDHIITLLRCGVLYDEDQGALYLFT